jgi:hypothetical protein
VPADGPTAGPFSVDTTFPEAVVLDKWPANAGGLGPHGGLALAAANASTSVSTVGVGTQRWIYDTSTPPENVKLLSFATPIGGVTSDAGLGPPSYCGRAMFTDIHAGGDGVPSAAPVPASCGGGPMSTEEKALEYAFFNLAGACVPPLPRPD